MTQLVESRDTKSSKILFNTIVIHVYSPYIYHLYTHTLLIFTFYIYIMSLSTIPFNTVYVGFTAYQFTGRLTWTSNGKMVISISGQPEIVFRMDREIDDLLAGNHNVPFLFRLIFYQICKLENGEPSGVITFHHIPNQSLPWMEKWECDFGPGMTSLL